MENQTSSCFDNVSIDSYYESLEDKEAQNKYEGLFCELCDLYGAFYGRIENDATFIDLMDRTKETTFSSKYLQSVYWGNYINQDMCIHVGEDKFFNSPFAKKKITKNGIYLAITDNMIDSRDCYNFKQRVKLLKYLRRNLVVWRKDLCE